MSPSFISAFVYEMMKYDDFTIFTMADLRHLEFYGSNNGFFEKSL